MICRLTWPLWLSLLASCAGPCGHARGHGGEESGAHASTTGAAAKASASLPVVHVAFRAPGADTWEMRDERTLSDASQADGPHGASGLAADSTGRWFLVTDRDADQGRNIRWTSGVAGDDAGWRTMEVEGPAACTHDLEAIRFDPSGRLWVASDAGYVGRGIPERDGAGNPRRVTLACSSPLTEGQFPRSDHNAGFEALFFVSDRAYVLSEKSVLPEGHGDTRHRLFRIDWPRLVPVADVDICGAGDRQVRITDGVACRDAVYWLGTYVEATARGYFVLEGVMSGDVPVGLGWHGLDNRAVGDAGPPNIEGMMASADCGALLIVNDDSLGNRSHFPRTLLRQVSLPRPAR